MLESENNPLRMIHYYPDRRSSVFDSDDAQVCELDNGVAAQRFQLPTGPDDRLILLNEPRSIGAELVRSLAVRLRQLKKRHGIKRLLVTSTVPGEGKTLVSANLATALSLHRSKVLLIDGDLRRASLSRWFDIADDAYSRNWQEDGSHILPMLRKAEGLPLWVIPAGEPLEMPGNVLQSAEFSDALAEIESEFDWVVFDSTPLVPFGEAGILASLVDAVVFVTRKGVTPKGELEEALRLLDTSKIVATILNCTNVTTHKYYLDYYAHVRRIPTPATFAGESSLPPLRGKNILPNKDRE